METSELAGCAALAAVAEVAYRDAAGVLRIEPLVPLRLGDQACFALTFDRSPLARDLFRSELAAVTFSDSRLALKGWRPLAAAARLEVVADKRGELFTTRLLDQELRKYPPARSLIDTPLMRRENWWYVPRMIVRVAEIRDLRSIRRRTEPNHAVAAWIDRGRPVADTVSVDDWESERPGIASLKGAGPPDGPAAVLWHDFAVPELDEWATFRLTGSLSGGRLRVGSREGARTLGRRLGLLERLRRLRALQSACRTELAPYEGGP